MRAGPTAPLPSGGHVSALRMSWAVVNEAVASARSQPVASSVAVLMVAGMCATVLLTTGRAVGAEREVIASIDAAGTRSIVVRADAASGLDTDVLERLAPIDGLAWVGAFGAADDVRNVAFPGGTAVPLRSLYTADFSAFGIDGPESNLMQSVDVAYASRAALEQFGMTDSAGGATSEDGRVYAVAGRLVVPDYLRVLEPLVVTPRVPARSAPAEPISVLVVVTTRPALVAPVSDIVRSVLDVEDPATVTIATSEELSNLRGLVEGQLRTFSAGLVGGVLAVTAALVAGTFYGVTTLRRKDFGRRRALGASQRLIVVLLLTQVLLLGALGAVLGAIAAGAALAVSADPLPGLSFFVAVAVLATGTSTTAAVLPALAAARRDPLRELRVP